MWYYFNHRNYYVTTRAFLFPSICSNEVWLVLNMLFVLYWWSLCHSAMITVLFFVVSYKEMTVGRDSSISISTCYGLQGPIPVGVRFSALIRTSPRTHQPSHKMCTGSFPEVKRTGCGGDYPLPTTLPPLLSPHYPPPTTLPHLAPKLKKE